MQLEIRHEKDGPLLMGFGATTVESLGEDFLAAVSISPTCREILGRFAADQTALYFSWEGAPGSIRARIIELRHRPIADNQFMSALRLRIAIDSPSSGSLDDMANPDTDYIKCICDEWAKRAASPSSDYAQIAMVINCPRHGTITFYGRGLMMWLHPSAEQELRPPLPGSRRPRRVVHDGVGRPDTDMR